MFNRWHFFDKITFSDGETLGDLLFSYEHPIMSMCSGPMVMVILFISLLWPISVVGKNGIIPAVMLLVCIVLMHLLYSKVSNTILFVWMQPFICYTEFIFTKYALAANSSDPGVGIMGWLVFAAVALVIMWYTALFLGIGGWGAIYLIPYGTAWVHSIGLSEVVFYVIAYMALFAVFMTVYVALRRIKNKDFNDGDLSILPGVFLFILTIFAYAQPEVANAMEPDYMQGMDSLINDPNTNGFIKFVAVVLNFCMTSPVTRAIGAVIEKLALLLAQYG